MTMRKALLFLLLIPAVALSQEFHRANRVVQNPNVADGNGYCFRGHLATATSSYCPEAEALFARMTTPPTDARKTVINTFITSLKTAGVWTKLDVLYVFAAADQQAALLNWKENNNNATAENSPSFIADSGFKSDGSSSWVNTHYNPYTDSVNFSIVSAHISVYVVTNVGAGDKFDIGGEEYSSAYSNSFINSNDGAPRIVGAICIDGYYDGYASVSSALGFSSIDRANGMQKYYKNGTYITSSSTAVKPIPNVDFGVCALNINFLGTISQGNYSTRRISQAAIGGALSATEETAFSAAVETYMDAVGCGILP